MTVRNEPRMLVTGAGGFLGRHLVEELRHRGADPIVAGRTASSFIDLEFDLGDPSAVDRALEATRPDQVVNCAAYGVDFADQDLGLAMDVNCRGALHLCNSAARHGVRRLLQVGSCFEYGSHPGPICEDAPLNPYGIYGLSKAAASLLLLERSRDLGLPVLIARPFGLWGPGEGVHRLVPQVVRACRERTELDLTPCDVYRDYSYVRDVAADLASLLELPSWDALSVVNLGSGREVLLRDFVERIASELGGAELMRFGRLPHRPNEIRRLVANVDRLGRAVTMSTATSLREGLQQMIDDRLECG